MSDTLHLILVDDNPDDRAVVIRELRQEFPGLEVLQILDYDSLVKVLEGSCDLVITDSQLPWATGLEVLQAVKKAAPTCPVIMFTRAGSKEAAVAAIKAGFDDYVMKPPGHLAHLPSAVNTAVRMARQRRAAQDVQGVHHAGSDAPPSRAQEVAITEVLADIAHELNTPLSIILGHATILRQDLAGTPNGEQVAKIVRAAERCARIIEEFLASAPQESPERPTVRVNQTPSEARILVVDDEPGIAGVLAEVLQLDGHVVEVVGDGEAALEKLAAGKYDLILSDVHMPDLDGIALYREVERRHPPLVRRFVFLTGDIMSHETLQFLAQTAVPCLSKPFTLEMVRAVVQRVITASRQVTGDGS